MIDYLESGSGPLIVLIHSSVSGARQWRKLMDVLSPDFRVRAVNLFGYGKTPPWPDDRVQTLDDQAALIAQAIPDDAPVMLVGHSFGGSVAMKLAARLGERVTKLVLLEPNPFFLLREAQKTDAFAEAWQLRTWIKEFGAAGNWMAAAEKFADYWQGPGAWAATPDDRRAAFASALKPNFHEWDAVMNEDETALRNWPGLLPRETCVLHDANTVRPIREIAELLKDACPHWSFGHIAAGGHMAPLIRPDLVNPLVCDYFRGGEKPPT